MRWNSFACAGAIILALAAPALAQNGGMQGRDAMGGAKFQVDTFKLQGQVDDLKAQVAKLQYSLDQTQQASIKTKNDLIQEHNQLMQTQNALSQDHALLMQLAQSVAEWKAFKKQYDQDKWAADHPGNKPPPGLGYHN